jgi:hypothetical protein
VLVIRQLAGQPGELMPGEPGFAPKRRHLQDGGFEAQRTPAA